MQSLGAGKPGAHGAFMAAPLTPLDPVHWHNWTIALGAFVAVVLIVAGILAGFFGRDSRF